MSIKWQIQSVIDRYAYPNTRKCFQRKNFEIVEISSLINEDISLYFDFIKYPDITIKKR